MSDSTVTANGQSDALKPQSLWVNRLEGMPGVALALLWGLAEGTFFFILPDVAISLLALLNPRRVWRHILATIAGSVFGGMFLFSWSCTNPRGAHEAVSRVPFVTARMFAQVHASYQMHGLGAVFLGPLSGIPYKIYAVEAPEFLSKAVFLSATVPARGERFLLVWAAFGVAGTLLRRFHKWTVSQLVTLHGSFWAVVYACYWGIIVFR
jgi:hypothetical protein